MDTLARWFDGERRIASDEQSVDWLRVLPFIALHAGCLCVFWVGWSPAALIAAAASYAVRVFAISGFFHRGFAHRAFRTGRITQFAFAFLGTAATQRGPLWWVAHHRRHHAHADTGDDPHQAERGFWWSHMGWFLTRAAFDTRMERVRDLVRFPELRWLNRFDALPPALFAAALFALGEALPGTDGWQFLVWGYVVSTVALLHATFLVNSLGHRCGRRSFATRDSSRNSAWLALLTLGEGWHNNHHRHAASARLGLRWWQFDPTYLLLRGLEALGLVHDLNRGPGWTRGRAAKRCA